MNSHKNARMTFEGRKLLIERIGAMGLKPAAQAAGISERTARKWLKRFEEHGVQGLLDRSSRPARARTSINAHLAERIERLRRARMPMRHIAQVVGRSVATMPCKKRFWMNRKGAVALDLNARPLDEETRCLSVRLTRQGVQRQAVATGNAAGANVARDGAASSPAIFRVQRRLDGGRGRP